MNHHEVGEGGRANRLSSKTIARPCGDRFSIGALLPGCAWLAALRRNALIDFLKISDRRSIIKKHAKRGSDGDWDCTEGFWGDSHSIFRFEQMKVD